MKKILAILFVASSVIYGCKKDNTQPSSSSSSNTQQVKKWLYEYDYKRQGDTRTYTAQSCLTDAEMTSLINNIGAFNVRQWHEC